MWHTLSTKEVERKMGTNLQLGLSYKQVEERRKKYGINQLEEKADIYQILRTIQRLYDYYSTDCLSYFSDSYQNGRWK